MTPAWRSGEVQERLQYTKISNRSPTVNIDSHQMSKPSTVFSALLRFESWDTSRLHRLQLSFLKKRSLWERQLSLGRDASTPHDSVLGGGTEKIVTMRPVAPGHGQPDRIRRCLLLPFANLLTVPCSRGFADFCTLPKAQMDKVSSLLMELEQMRRLRCCVRSPTPLPRLDSRFSAAIFPFARLVRSDHPAPPMDPATAPG